MAGKRSCFHLSQYHPFAKTLIDIDQQHNAAARNGLRHMNDSKRATESCGSPVPAFLDELGVLIQVIADGTDMMVLTNFEGIIIYANQAFLASLRYSAEDLTGKNFSGTLSKHNRFELLQEINTRMHENCGWKGDCLLTRHDDTDLLVALKVGSIKNKGGRKIGAFGIAQGLLGQHQAQRDLQRSEEQFRQLADHIREVFFILNVAPIQMAYISPAFDEIWGRSRQELYDRPAAWIESVHAEDRQQVGAFYARCMQGVEAEMEYRVVQPSGSVRWIRARSFPVLDADGKFIRVVGIAEDITAQHLALGDMQRTRATAEAANRIKSEFLANMSHELRTPLNGILSMAEMALDTDSTSELREYLSMLKASADSLLTVINDILDFSKIEAGKLDFEPIEFNIRSNAEASMKSLAIRAHAKDLELNCRVRPEVPKVVLGDPRRLRQIIVNLVGNAIKFTERGEVTLDVQVESAEPGSSLLHFTVADSGIGIPQEKQTKIFDAFTQADGSTARRYGGSGLGLTLSQQLVEMFGGRLWLESVVGKGSTFHFTARFEVAGASGKELLLPEVNLEGVPVLAVDHSPTNRRILEELLTDWRMNPTLLGETRAALTQLKQSAEAGRPFPLVLVDAAMPELDGFSLVELIKQDSRLAKAGIVVLTSAGQRGDAVRSRHLGLAAYLTRPVGQTELLNAIFQVLDPAPQGNSPLVLPVHKSVPESKKMLRFLVAEDNLVNQMIVVRQLKKRGHSVEVASDGHEALKILKLGNCDLALMDVQMPHMDGFEATAAIREIEKTQGGHFPIIAMTAHALKGDRERCLAAGMDGYISKPFQIDVLLKEIERLAQFIPSTV
jgi:two-component system sensor histidine kinase/response regulator